MIKSISTNNHNLTRMSNPVFKKFDGKILLVSDDKDLLTSLEYTVAGEGYQYNKAQDGKDALLKLRQLVPHVLIIDNEIPDKEEKRLISPIKRYKKYAGVQIIRLYAEQDIAVKSDKPNEYKLPKPVDFLRLKQLLGEIFGFV